MPWKHCCKQLELVGLQEGDQNECINSLCSARESSNKLQLGTFTVFNRDVLQTAECAVSKI